MCDARFCHSTLTVSPVCKLYKTPVKPTFRVRLFSPWSGLYGIITECKLLVWRIFSPYGKKLKLKFFCTVREIHYKVDHRSKVLGSTAQSKKNQPARPILCSLFSVQADSLFSIQHTVRFFVQKISVKAGSLFSIQRTGRFIVQYSSYRPILCSLFSVLADIVHYSAYRPILCSVFSVQADSLFSIQRTGWFIVQYSV
jgi:hypothetical protein